MIADKGPNAVYDGDERNKAARSMKCVIANIQNAGDDNLQTEEQIRVNLGIDQLERK